MFNISPSIVRLFKNFTSLALIQGTNFILPLMVIPHLTRVVTIEKYGLISIAQVIALYLVIFSEFGFNLSATKRVSENRDDPKALNSIFNATIATRIFLCFIAFIILVILTFSIPYLRNHYQLYLLSSTIFFGQALIPVWYFLGIEKMKFITYVNLIAKSVLTLSTFIFIRSEEDYIYANFINGLGSIIAGVISLYIVYRNFGIKFSMVNFHDIKKCLKDSFEIFTSNFATNVYLNINIIILQFFANESVVGMYSVAEKVFTALKNLISVVFQTVYPFACKLKQDSEKKLKSFFTRYIYISVVFFAIVGLTTFFLSEFIIGLMSDKPLPLAVALLKCFSFIPVIITLSVPAFQSSLIFNHKSEFSRIMILAATFNIIINAVLTFKLGSFGTVLSVALTEAFVMVALNFLIFNKEKFTFFNIRNINNKLDSSL